MILVMLLAACRPPASAPEVAAGAPPVSTVAPEVAPAVAPVPAGAHPGTITFVDRDTGETSVSPVTTVPESIAWATVGAQRVAVVRIESSAAGGHREIFRYGADGTLLDTTVAGP